MRPPFEAGWLPTEARRIIENEFHRALRYRHPLSLLLLAVDGYDAMVRLHGPEAADHYLETLETALLPSLRRADRILRSGAHELAILLPETDRTGARVAGERLLGQTRRLLVRPPAGVEQRSLPIKTTASVGGCDAPREDLDESGLMIELARVALEVARMKGGDRARLHGDPVD